MWTVLWDLESLFRIEGLDLAGSYLACSRVDVRRSDQSSRVENFRAAAPKDRGQAQSLILQKSDLICVSG